MKDLFSNQASAYAAFRPTYPKELYDFVLNNVRNKDVAWDCATGNGQVARDLSVYFKKVIATDISAKQIDNAVSAGNIEYAVSPAEETSFPDSSFDLITVGQAIHWFNFSEFYKEAVRVAKPGALLAVWGYGLLRINSSIDRLVDDFYVNKIGPYWDAERKHVDAHYKTIPFPFKEIPSPQFSFSFKWTLAEFEGYLTTWSSVQKYIKTNGESPVEDFIQSITPLWTSGEMKVSFPLFMKCGRIDKYFYEASRALKIP